MDGDKASIAKISDQVQGIESTETREVLQHVINRGRLLAERQCLKNEVRRSMIKPVGECIEALRKAWEFLRRDKSDLRLKNPADIVGDQDEDDDLRRWVIAAELTLIGGGEKRYPEVADKSNKRRFPKDDFKNLALEAYDNAVEILVKRCKAQGEDTKAFEYLKREIEKKVEHVDEEMRIEKSVVAMDKSVNEAPGNAPLEVSAEQNPAAEASTDAQPHSKFTIILRRFCFILNSIHSFF